MGVIAQLRRFKAGPALHALAVVTVLLFASTNAHADYLSLLTPGATGTINGAQFIQGDNGAAGTGVFPAFVRVQRNDNEQGYNTPNNVPDNTNDDTHNLNVRLNQLGVVTATIGGVANVQAYQFFLDINEAGGGNEWLSLDELRIRTGTTESPVTPSSSFDSIPNSVQRYNIDTGTNNGLLMNFQIESGSGKADVTMLVPVSFFAGALPTDFVYLYSRFGLLTTTPTCGGGSCTGFAAGQDYTSSDGFEEWAYRAGTGVVIPEPSTYALYALGASMLFVSGWWQKRRKALPTTA
jgi:hypothetical protein